MYNVIFVDDEEEARNRITELIDFEKNGFCLLDTFENGYAALDYISDNSNVDLLITDISMPYLSGVELAEKVHNLYPHIKVVFLSGYDKIDYAKDAIRYGVIEYLTKPISIDSFTLTLDKVRVILDEQKEKDTSNESLKKYEEQTLPILRESILFNLVSKDNINYETFIEDSKMLHLDYSYPLFVVAIVKIKNNNIDKPFDFEKNMIYVKKYIDDDSKAFNIKEDSVLIYDKLVIIIKLNDSRDTITTVEKLFGSVSLKIKRYFEKELECGVSNGITSISKIREAYHQAQHAVYQKELTSKDFIKFYSETSTFDTILTIDEHEINAFKYAIKYLSFDEANKNLDIIFKKIFKSNTLNEYQYFATTILNAIINSSSNVKDIYDKYSPNTIYEVVMKLIVPTKLRDFFSNLLRFVQEDNNKIRLNQVSSSLKIITDFIALNYHDVNLSLDYMSEKIGYSTSYICMVFKKELNTTFVKHLTQIRMEKAKDLLLKSQLLVIDICTMCGYAEPYYFSSTFKKYSGMSPRAFREKEKN